MLEIACFTSPSAIAAARAGAHRIELCSTYTVGGTTPSLATLHSIRIGLKKQLLSKQTNIPINVMIRPRGGNFIYSSEEFTQMKDSIETFKSSKDMVQGFVFGILDVDGKIDKMRNRELVDAARPLPCTFHRAVDETPQLEVAIEGIIECGFESVLTSGGSKSASAGAERVAELNGRYGRRISFILGGGVRSANVVRLKLETGVEWVHSAAITVEGEEVDEGEVEEMHMLLRDV